MSRKNRNKHKQTQPANIKKKESFWDILKDLFTNPFEYKHSTKYLGKVLGGICIFLALCLVFYLTGH
jgi:hypothetical protein